MEIIPWVVRVSYLERSKVQSSCPQIPRRKLSSGLPCPSMTRVDYSSLQGGSMRSPMLNKIDKLEEQEAPKLGWFWMLKGTLIIIAIPFALGAGKLLMLYLGDKAMTIAATLSFLFICLGPMVYSIWHDAKKNNTSFGEHLLTKLFHSKPKGWN